MTVQLVCTVLELLVLHVLSRRNPRLVGEPKLLDPFALKASSLLKVKLMAHLGVPIIHEPKHFVRPHAPSPLRLELS